MMRAHHPVKRTPRKRKAKRPHNPGLPDPRTIVQIKEFGVPATRKPKRKAKRK